MKHTKMAFFLCALACALLTKPAQCIDISDADKRKLLGLEQQSFSSGMGSMPLSSQAFEGIDNSIDPDQYMVGGGDGFIIAIIDAPTMKYEAKVDNDGNLYIPELGLITLGKLSLSQAKETISKFIKAKLRKQSDLYIALTAVKKATVSISGSVANPGTYVAPGAYRILDAIRMANDDKLPSLSECNYREVHVVNRGNDTVYDLYPYILKNNISSNPYVYPGDNIRIDFALSKAILNAPVRGPVGGWIPVKANESLADFLQLFTFEAFADTASITIQSGDESRVSQTIAWSEAASIVVHNRDIITIRSKKQYAPIFMVSISGEVNRSGSFPIVRDVTTVQEILDLADGPTQYANPDRAFIIRNSKIGSSGVQENGRVGSIELAARDLAMIRPEISAALNKMALSKDFSVIDLKGTDSKFKLIPDDNIVIPKKEYSVYVSGNVKKPGAYEFVNGKGYSYYIGKAGGYTSRADRSNLFALGYYNGISQVKDINNFGEGDVLVVPDSREGKKFNTAIQIIGAVGAVVTTIISIYSITK